MRRLSDEGSADEGFVIVIVLAVLSLLALAAIVLQKSVSADARAVALLAGRARAEALADGLTRLAIRHLAVNTPAENRSGLFDLDGRPISCRAGGQIASIDIVNVDGQVNLNLSSEGLLSRIMTGLGTSETDASALARNIIDFRTAGDVALSGEDKATLYANAGLRHGPKMAPFETVGELDQVLGFTPALVDKLRPLLTVHSRFGAIKLAVASLPVATALAGGQSSAPLDILRTQLQLPIEFTYVPRSRSGANVSSNTYAIRVSVGDGAAARFTRFAIVELKPSTEAGVAIQQWGEWPAASQAVAVLDATGAPNCIGAVLLLDPA